jgi:uncharacterized RDD family membrane protein YckC
LDSEVSGDTMKEHRLDKRERVDPDSPVQTHADEAASGIDFDLPLPGPASVETPAARFTSTPPAAPAPADDPVGDLPLFWASGIKIAPEKASGSDQGEVETGKPWREELADKVESYRVRRSRSRRTEPLRALEFDFTGGGAVPEARQDPPARPQSSGSVEGPDDPAVQRQTRRGPQTPAHSPASEAESEMLEEAWAAIEDSSPVLDEENWLGSMAGRAAKPSIAQPTVTRRAAEQGLASADDRGHAYSVRSAIDGDESGLNAAPGRLAAPILERFLAGVTDVLVLMFAFAIFSVIFWRSGGRFEVSTLNLVALGLIFASIGFTYFALFTALTAATPGMSVMGLEVRTFEGGFPNRRTAWVRTLGYMVSTSTFMLGFIWSVVESDGLTWHDRISDSMIVRRGTVVPEDQYEASAEVTVA